MAPMVLLVAAALVTAPPEQPASVVAQVTATIRVVAGIQLKLDGSPNPDAPSARDSVVKANDGTNQPAKLIEFQ